MYVLIECENALSNEEEPCLELLMLFIKNLHLFLGFKGLAGLYYSYGIWIEGLLCQGWGWGWGWVE